ncbi:MAG: pyridoxal phosphate-dependent aminotransferase family protein [Planctomycetes bacterium]|nr:pyridoxal phosphate-dependent aminotransferase family protein [Planctomycetota bacterium]
MDLFQKCFNFTRAKEVQAAGFYPYFIPIARSRGTEVEIQGRRLVMIGSNNYLGLTHHPHVVESAVRALEKYGSSPTGSRFLNGTLELHEELERRLARFLNRESALVFSTGFQTNLGVISALCGKGDVILCDRDDHASIVDGCRLSFAEVRKFKHNDMQDLEYQLQRASADRSKGKLIVVDGAFSMLGDLASLKEIVRLAKAYDARVMVDEAHSVGVIGAHGRGAAEHLGVEGDVDLIGGTFSKSFASLGGFVAGPEPVIHYIKHHARSLIFSASIPASAAAAALAALDVMEAEPELRHRVIANANRVRRGLAEMGFRVGPTETAIIPVIVGEQTRMFRVWKALFDGGLFINPVTVPAVPPGMDLIRTSYMATHSDEQIDRVLEVFGRVGRELGLLSDAPSSKVAGSDLSVGADAN